MLTVRNTRLIPRACLVTLSIFFLLLSFSTSPVTPVSVASGDEKIKPEELVAKHLESIGTAEARAAARNRIITGVSELIIKQGGFGNLVGNALLASEGEKNLIIMAFDRPDYPAEKIAYDGQNVTVATIRPGVRSPLGAFFRTYDEIFKEGLMGGTLSQAWPLLNVAGRAPKLEYGGMKKFNGRPAHELKYTPKNGSDLKIKLYFDSETFRHIRSEYERVIAATMGARPIQSGGRLDSRYKVIEEFSDFKTESGLTLPHTHKFELRVTSENAPMLLNWALTLHKFDFNQTMTAKEFDVDGS
jgi:hypothetical protein